MLQELQLTSAVARIYRKLGSFRFLLATLLRLLAPCNVFNRFRCLLLTRVFFLLVLLDPVFVVGVFFVIGPIVVAALGVGAGGSVLLGHPPQLLDFFLSLPLDVVLEVEQVIIILLLQLVLLKVLLLHVLVWVLQECLVAPLGYQIHGRIRPFVPKDLVRSEVDIERIGVVPACEEDVRGLLLTCVAFLRLASGLHLQFLEHRIVVRVLLVLLPHLVKAIFRQVRDVRPDFLLSLLGLLLFFLSDH